MPALKFVRLMKWLSIAALVIAVLWRASLDYRVVLSFVITISAVAVIVQAARAGRYVWVILFFAIATMFNPVLTGALPSRAYLWTDLGCLVAFAASLVVLKNKPILSIASITDRTPGSASL